METKRELNDILISDDDLQKQNRTKKLMMMVAMALVFFCILIAVIFVITRDEDEIGEREAALNNGLMPIESQRNESDFVNVPLNNASDNAEADPFKQILDDIRSRDTNTQIAQNTQPLPTEPKQPVNATPIEPTKPAQPVKPSTPATQPKPTQSTADSKKPSQPVLPNKPATQPTQNIANMFNEAQTSSNVDTSKNGQVAEKGFYIQVGSFTNKPSADFMRQISNYSYRVYAGTSNGQQTTKYLVGPYPSRVEASRDLPSLRILVSEPIHFEVK